MSAERAGGAGVLELAVLGLLHESPMHGYEINKRLKALLGAFKRVSYGSLYPALARLQAGGLLTVEDTGAAATMSGRRRVAYTLTAEGKERFAQLVADAGPATWEDDAFGVRFAFFGRTDAATRLRILEGRRTRLEERREERREGLRSARARARERLDTYTLQLQEHGLESVEREVRWLNELIESERSLAPPARAGSGVPAATRRHEPPAESTGGPSDPPRTTTEELT